MSTTGSESAYRVPSTPLRDEVGAHLALCSQLRVGRRCVASGVRRVSPPTVSMIPAAQVLARRIARSSKRDSSLTSFRHGSTVHKRRVNVQPSSTGVRTPFGPELRGHLRVRQARNVGSRWSDCCCCVHQEQLASRPRERTPGNWKTREGWWHGGVTR